MEVRCLTNEERGLAAALWRYCFLDPPAFVDWYFSWRAGEILGLMEGGRLAAQIVNVPLALNLRGEARRASILSGIATAPAYRRQGHISTLMREGLAFAKGQGACLAALYPFDYGFYRQYGFTPCGDVAKVRTRLDRLPSARPRGEISLVGGTEGDCALLAEAYRESYGQYSGCAIRDSAAFGLRLGEHALDGGYTAIYRRGGVAEAYLLYHMENTTLHVDEIGAASPLARGDMLSFLHSHTSTLEMVEFTCPIDEPIWRMLPDPRGAVNIEPYNMFRIVDIAAAMHGLPAGEGDMTLHVEDPYAPWNEGFWRFYSNDGVLAVESVAEQDVPGISIGGLSAWALGCADGQGLRLDEPSSHKGCLVEMDRLLPRQPVFLYEMY